MKLAVIGAGAIGGWLTAGFVDAGAQATVLARGAALAALRRHKLLLDEGQGPRVIPVTATDDPAALRGADVLLLGLRPHDLPAMAPVIAGVIGPQTIVLPAINGLPWWFFARFGGRARGMTLETLDPAEVLSRAIPADQVVGAVVHATCRVERPGYVQLLRANKLWLGNAGRGDHAAGIAAWLARGGIPAEESPQIHHEVWGKLWGISSLKPLSALARADVAQMLGDDGVRGLILAMMREMSELGAQIGLEAFDDFDGRMITTEKLGALRTTMLQDLEAGRKLELAPVLGALVELSRKLRVPTPVMDGVHGLTRLLDAENRRKAARQRMPA